MGASGTVRSGRRVVVVLDCGGVRTLGLDRGLSDLAIKGSVDRSAIQKIGMHGVLYKNPPLFDAVAWYDSLPSRKVAKSLNKMVPVVLRSGQNQGSVCIEVGDFNPGAAAEVLALVDVLRKGGFDVTVVLPVLPAGKRMQVCYGAYLWAGGTETLAAWYDSYQLEDDLPAVLQRLSPIVGLEAVPLSDNEDLEAVRRLLLAKVWPGSERRRVAPMTYLAPSAFELVRVANSAVRDLDKEARGQAMAIARKILASNAFEPLFCEGEEDPLLNVDLSEQGMNALSTFVHRGVSPKHLVDFMLASGVRIHKKSKKVSLDA